VVSNAKKASTVPHLPQQLTGFFLMMQNQLQRNLKDLKKEEQFEYILLVIFFNSVKSIYFNQFSCLICIQAVDVGPYQTMR